MHANNEGTNQSAHLLISAFDLLSLESMRGPRKICQRRSNFDSVFFFFFFLVYRGEGIKVPLYVGHYWPASETCRLANDGPTLNVGLVAL